MDESEIYFEIDACKKASQDHQIDEGKSLTAIKFNAKFKSSGSLIASLHQLQQPILNCNIQEISPSHLETVQPIVQICSSWQIVVIYKTPFMKVIS